jgi:hypothetical protein
LGGQNGYKWKFVDIWHMWLVKDYSKVLHEELTYETRNLHSYLMVQTQKNKELHHWCNFLNIISFGDTIFNEVKKFYYNLLITLQVKWITARIILFLLTRIKFLGLQIFLCCIGGDHSVLKHNYFKQKALDNTEKMYSKQGIISVDLCLCQSF